MGTDLIIGVSGMVWPEPTSLELNDSVLHFKKANKYVACLDPKVALPGDSAAKVRYFLSTLDDNPAQALAARAAP